MAIEIPPRIGVSSCLLGAPVRYDGGHKRVDWLADELAAMCELIAICPEMEIGLGTPRPPIQLVARAYDIRACGVTDPTFDVTDGLRAYAHESAKRHSDLSGYLFKSRSPSCALTDAAVQGEQTYLRAGIYAATFREDAALLPMTDEAGIADKTIRAHFIEQVFAHRRWQQFLEGPLTASALIAFHTRHKLAIMAHDEAIYRALGRLLADLTAEPLGEIAAEYGAMFMRALAQPTHAGRQVDALMHAVGFLKEALTTAEKRAFNDTLRRLSNGECDIDEPIAQIRGFLKQHPQAYLASQTYLDLSPAEWRLRFGASAVHLRN